MAFDKTRAAAVAAKWGPLVFVVIAIGTLLATWFTSYVRDRPRPLAVSALDGTHWAGPSWALPAQPRPLLLALLCALRSCRWFWLGRISSQALGDDWGGLKVPYISDTAKTPPNYIVFAVGLTVSAAIYAGLAAMSALAAHALGAATGDARLRRLTWPTLVFAILAALGLALLAIFNTLVYPTAHLAFALMFFVCAMVWIGLDLAANRRWIGDAAAAAPPYRRRWIAKRIIAVGAYIAFVIYIPIGLTIVERTSACGTRTRKRPGWGRLRAGLGQD